MTQLMLANQSGDFPSTAPTEDFAFRVDQEKEKRICLQLFVTTGPSSACTLTYPHPSFFSSSIAIHLTIDIDQLPTNACEIARASQLLAQTYINPQSQYRPRQSDSPT